MTKHKEGNLMRHLIAVALLALATFVPVSSVGAATDQGQSLTGSGWRGNVRTPTVPTIHFVVSAHNGPRGVFGTYTSMNPNQPLVNFSGRVTCLYVVGNQAIVGGLVTSGGAPGQIGTGFAVGFVDNASPTADAVTFSDVEIATPVDCAAETFLFTLTNFPVLNGNLVLGTSS